MALLGTGALTLADWAKRRDPNGKTPYIVELLAQVNEPLEYMQWVMGNLPTGHRTTVRTGLPAVSWRLINQGVTPSKSTTAQIDAQCGMLEAWSEVDVKLARLENDVAAFRASEGMAFVEAMSQEVMQTILYGNQGLAPSEFTGLFPHYSLISATPDNIIDAGGTGSDNASIFLGVWGERTIMGIFPSGSNAGLQHQDFGEVTVEVTAGIGGTRMRALQEMWSWDCGIALRDYRAGVRIVNIDVPALAAGTGADLVTLLIKAEHRVPNLRSTGGKAFIMMNRSVFQYLDIQRRSDVMSGGQLSYNEVDGIRKPSWRGIPIALTDAMLDTETRVV